MCIVIQRLFAATAVVLDQPPLLTVWNHEVLQACEDSLQLTSVNMLHLKLFTLSGLRENSQP